MEERGLVVNTEEAKRSRLREAAVPTLAGALVLSASFVNFLNYNDYPLARPEVGFVLLGLIGFALATGLIYAGAERIGRALLQILLVYLAMDLNFDGYIVPLLTATVVLVLNRHMMPFVSVAAGVVLVSAVFGSILGAGEAVSRPTAETQLSRSDLPAVLHLILDEHVGVEGILGDEPEASAMRSELRQFYSGHGFRLFGGAYSEYFHTVNSIPQLMNFGKEQQHKGPGYDGLVLTNNAYFGHLSDAGYRIKVYQNAFMQFCDPRHIDCHETRKQDYGAIDGTTINTGERAGLLTRGFASLSPVAFGIAVLVPYVSYRAGLTSPFIDGPPQGHARVSAIATLKTIRQITDQLRYARPGEVYFAHLLLPHDPYSLRPDCSIKPVTEWIVRRSQRVTRKETQRAYFDQVRCLNTLLASMIQALGSSDGGVNTVVIIHGDHGYRDALVEPIVENLGSFADESLVAAHATLFAVRARGVAAGYDDRRLPLSALLSSFVQSGFKSVDVAEPTEHKVILGDNHWKPVQEHPLPRWWAEP